MEEQDGGNNLQQRAGDSKADSRRERILNRAEATLQRDRQRDRSILNFVDGKVLVNAGKIYDMECQELDQWAWKEILRRQRYFKYQLYPLLIDALWDWLEIDLGELRKQRADYRLEAQKADQTPILVPATIYALLAPDAPEPFALVDIRYVGQSRDPESRYAGHVRSDSDRSPKGRWIASLRSKGLRPKMRFLAKFDAGATQSAVDFEECLWIAYLRYTVRAKLTNLSAGGLGDFRGNAVRNVVRSQV